MTKQEITDLMRQLADVACLEVRAFHTPEIRLHDNIRPPALEFVINPSCCGMGKNKEWPSCHIAFLEEDWPTVTPDIVRSRFREGLCGLWEFIVSQVCKPISAEEKEASQRLYDEAYEECLQSVK